MSRTTRRVIGMLGALALLATASAAAPYAFRGIDAYRVHSVEVAGARFLSPADVLMATGITDSSNVFDDAHDWSDALERHSLVDGVRVERRPPHTLRFHVTEAEPVAFAPLPELAAVDAQGRVLPIDPTAGELDLPVLARRAKLADDSLLDETSRRLVRALVTIRSLDAALASHVSEIAPAGGGGVRLTIDGPMSFELLLPDTPTARGLLQVRLALDHLRATLMTMETGTGSRDHARPHAARIDARYREELFVTFARGSD